MHYKACLLLWNGYYTLLKPHLPSPPKAFNKNWKLAAAKLQFYRSKVVQRPLDTKSRAKKSRTAQMLRMPFKYRQGPNGRRERVSFQHAHRRPISRAATKTPPTPPPGPSRLGRRSARSPRPAARSSNRSAHALCTTRRGTWHRPPLCLRIAM